MTKYSGVDATFDGPVTSPAVTASGLTGATGASRYVGATATGAPSTGTFAVGDFVIARDGQVWVCTVAGTPGTWVSSSTGGTVSAAGVTNTPAGNIAATNVQTALNELDTEKAALAGATFTGAVAGTSSAWSSFVSVGSNAAQSGAVRLPNSAWITARNTANTGDVNMWAIDSSSRILCGNLAGVSMNTCPITVYAVNVTDGNNFVLGSTTGTKIGTATTQKLGFFNATPVVQPANTVNTRDALISLGLVASGGSTALDNGPQPGDFAYKSWAYDANAAVNAIAPTSGMLHLSRLQFRGPDTVNKICFGVVSIAGISLTAGQCFVGLYDSTGTQVGTSTDISGGFGSVGEKAFTLTAPVSVSTGFYWAALLLVGTLPTIARGQGQITDFGSGQLTAATRRFGSGGSALTALPASFTPSSVASVTSQNFWFAAA